MSAPVQRREMRATSSYSLQLPIRLSCLALVIVLSAGCAATMTPQQQQSTAFGMGLLRTALGAASLLQQPTTASAKNTNALVGIAAGVQLFSQVDGFLQKRPPTIISNQPFSRAARIANELARVSPRYGQSIQLWIWPSQNPAFTTGNTVVIDPGFADRLSDEHLRAVLAHEMAHGDLGHELIGVLVQAGAAYLAVKADSQYRPSIQLIQRMATAAYTREQEVDADLAGAYYFQRLGYRSESFASLFDWMAAQGFDSTAGWLSTHPSMPERAQRLLTVLASSGVLGVPQMRTFERPIQKMLAKGQIATVEADGKEGLRLRVRQEAGAMTNILLSPDTKLFSGQREVSLETIQERIGSPVEVAYTFNPNTNEQKAVLVELPAPPILIVFYKDIQIDGDRKLTYDVQDALTLLERKSRWAFRDVRKYVGLVKMTDQDRLDLTKEPAALEVNSKTASQSTSWLAGVLASGACHIRGQREYRQQIDRECAEYQHKVLHKIKAPKEELAAVKQLVIAAQRR